MTWARDSKPKTARTEIYYLKAMIGYFEGQGVPRLDNITPEHVENFRIWIRQQDRRTHPIKGHPPLYPTKATANRYCATLRTLYNRASDWGAFKGVNPVSKVKFYKENGKVKPMSPDDLEKVKAAARAISAKPASPAQKVISDMIVFAVHTGVRKFEALHLRWRDVRDDEVELHGKGDKERAVPLNTEARAAIDRQPRIGAFVFDVPNRDSWDPLRLTIEQIRRKSGVEHFHFHLCRHFFVSALLEAGVDLETIARLTGHSRMTTTLIYAHSTPERMRAAVALLVPKHGHTPADAKKRKHP